MKLTNKEENEHANVSNSGIDDEAEEGLNSQNLILSYNNHWKFFWKKENDVNRNEFPDEIQDYLNYKHLEFLSGIKGTIYLIHNSEYYIIDFTKNLLILASDKSTKMLLVIEDKATSLNQQKNLNMKCIE